VSRLPDVSGRLPADVAAELAEMLRRRGGTGAEAYRRLAAHPPLMRAVAGTGGFLRYEGVLPDDLREMVILRVAARTGSAYEWAMHEALARDAGVPAPLVEALRAGATPVPHDGVWASALRITDAVLAHAPLDQDDHDAVADALGEPAVIELVVLAAFYAMFAAVLIGFEVPLPDG
jgi:4-carboxymuconolactone decarboxylase